jgi:hypothetical protein
MEKFEDMELDRQWDAEQDRKARPAWASLPGLDGTDCKGCGEWIADPKHCPHCDDAAHETRHDEWRAWLVIGSGVALVALLWWVAR